MQSSNLGHMEALHTLNSALPGGVACGTSTPALGAAATTSGLRLLDMDVRGQL